MKGIALCFAVVFACFGHAQTNDTTFIKALPGWIIKSVEGDLRCTSPDQKASITIRRGHEGDQLVEAIKTQGPSKPKGGQIETALTDAGSLIYNFYRDPASGENAISLLASPNGVPEIVILTARDTKTFSQNLPQLTKLANSWLQSHASGSASADGRASGTTSGGGVVRTGGTKSSNTTKSEGPGFASSSSSSSSSQWSSSTASSLDQKSQSNSDSNRSFDHQQDQQSSSMQDSDSKSQVVYDPGTRSFQLVTSTDEDSQSSIDGEFVTDGGLIKGIGRSFSFEDSKLPKINRGEGTFIVDGVLHSIRVLKSNAGRAELIAIDGLAYHRAR